MSFRLVLQQFGLLCVGIAVAAVGVVIGAGSHQVVYQTVEKAEIIHYLVGSDNDTVYIQLANGSLYYLQQKDFTPALNANTLQSPMTTLVYNSSDARTIDATTSSQDVHLSGEAFLVVKLISYNVAQQNAQTYATQEYSQQPNGFYQNNWLIGVACLTVGVALSLVALVLRKRSKSSATAAPAAPVTSMNSMPFAPAYYQSSQAGYQQPGQLAVYRQPIVYNQTSISGAFQPVPPPYQSPLPAPVQSTPPAFQPPNYQPTSGSFLAPKVGLLAKYAPSNSSSQLVVPAQQSESGNYISPPGTPPASSANNGFASGQYPLPQSGLPVDHP